MSAREWVARVSYPLTFALAVATFAAVRASGADLLIALYLPIALTFVVVALLEWQNPLRLDWRPQARDVAADAAFMAVVQFLLPRALAAGFAVSAAGWMHARAPSRLWPHAWPLAAEALLMVLAVDFLRYWLHRGCHHFAPLWRLHEVHHSPDILYSLNVGRFHPIEKLLHFSADTVPFVLLGVDRAVLAAYLLLYAVNGIFQHSNVRLRYGWLNWVVGSAETHRWHHARDPRLAWCNFGNTTIVWDLLFGTWYLPRGREVADIGILDRAYPQGFLAQMVAPLHRRERGKSLGARFADLALGLHLRWTRLRHGWGLRRALRDPLRAQLRVLARILRLNGDTGFGREHGFSAIDGPAAFAAKVPVRDYEGLRPWIEAHIARGEAALTREPPEWYLRTSGTTGKAKDIPLTASHRAELRRLNSLALALQHRLCPEAFAGSILALTSPAREGVLENGRPYGSASGIVSASAPWMVQEKFVLPPAALAVENSQLKYQLILRLALARRRITYIGTANATTLLRLMQVYREHEPALLADLENGGFFRAADLPPGTLRDIGHRLKRAPWRAREIAALRRGGAPLRLADLWPELRMIVTWTRASAGLAVEALRAELGPGTRIQELGYLASELRGTISIGRRPGSGLPTADVHFYEFVERDRWERGEPVFLTLDRLERGGVYYLVVTTPSGLYRYFINDLVRVTGHLHRMPLLEFVQKGKGATNLTGEKLYESQVLEAVVVVLAELGRRAPFLQMLADAPACRYRLYVEPDSRPELSADELGRRVDERLAALNVEWQGKRESGRLGPIRACWLRPGAAEALKQEQVRRGQREGQWKSVALAYLEPTTFDFESWVDHG